MREDVNIIFLVGLWSLTVILTGEAAASSLGTLGKAKATRAQALGGAGVAIGLDPTMVWLNPASAGRLTTRSLTMSGQTGFLGGFTGQVLGVLPVLDGMLAVGGVLDDAGSVTLNALDGTSRTVNARRDIMGILSYSGALSPQMTGGFSLKGLQSELAEEFRATGVAFDLGFQLRMTDSVKTGIAVRNFGSNFKYLNDAITSPAQFRAGIAVRYQFDDFSPFVVETNHVLIAVLDAEHQLQDGRTFWRGGLEYHWHRIVVLRAGGRLGSAKSLGNLSTGLGFRLHKRRNGRWQQYRLDYSIRLLTSSFDPPQALSMTIAF